MSAVQSSSPLPPPKRVSGQGAATGMRSLLRLLPFAKPYAWHFVGIFVLVVLYNLSSVLQPYLVKVAIDSDITGAHPNPHGLLVISAIYAASVVIGVGANMAQILLLQYAGQRVVRAIRMRLFTHMEQQSMSFFDQNSMGRLVTNVSSDTETVSQFFTQFFLSLVRDGLSIVMIIIAMLELNLRIGLESLLIVPIIFGISLAFRHSLKQAYQTTRTRLSNIVSFLAENLAGMRITQIFHQEERQGSVYNRLNEAHRQANVHEYGVSMFFNRTLEWLGNAAVASVVWFGGGSVLDHAIQFGVLYAFISYIRQFFQPINSITQQWNTLQSSMVAAERISRVLSEEPAIADTDTPLGPEVLARITGRVTFAGVTFAYKPGEPVLVDLSFEIKPGALIGFVGPTGAGKSSLVSLLTRFYEPQEGVITLDGHSLRDFSQADLHTLVGLLQQDVHLFTGSVLDNIRLFRPDISERVVLDAAQAVGAHDLIMRLPDGYNTRLYGKGANLSMGERQMLSFARVVALNPRILILDEATASLDSQTEALVSRGLAAVSANRTTLVIAHRLSTVRHADQIYVLERGRIIERGNHDQLVQQGGLYAGLVAQSGIEASPGEPAAASLGRGEGKGVGALAVR